MRISVALGVSVLLFVSAIWARPAPTQACGIDGIPSLTVNGYMVVINKQVPVGPGLRLWAPFVLSFSLHARRAEVLAELPQRVPLQPEAFRNPWRWNFGDGSAQVRGITVHHTFSKPGIYKITVAAYFPSRKFWYIFDAVQVRVLPG
ncbi:MAG TPA: PKD domain-containing protein [Chloroflexota bacterium]